MSKILFRLNGVPEDEIEEIRELLIEHAVDFYETPPEIGAFQCPLYG